MSAAHPRTGLAPAATSSSGPTGWHGRLSLAYRRESERTHGNDRHHGPLRVLKALYPEGPGVCHHVLVHPPGGIVGGDRLDIDISLDAEAHAVITTPGATRFYRSGGQAAVQRLSAQVGPGARLEWLPLETIAYRGTRATNRMRFELAPGGQMIGWDLLALGLPAAGEAFTAGRFEQHLELPGTWLERGIVDPGEALGRLLLDSPLGWDGRTALCTMWCAAGEDWPAPLLETLLEAARSRLAAGAQPGRSGATSPTPRVVVVRALADRIEPLWATMQSIREDWRGLLWGSPAISPRVWRT